LKFAVCSFPIPRGSGRSRSILAMSPNLHLRCRQLPQLGQSAWSVVHCSAGGNPMRRWVLLSVLILLALSGCSGRLTRGNAADMIFAREIQFHAPVMLQLHTGRVWSVKHNYVLGKCFFWIEPETLWARDHGFVEIISDGDESIVTLTNKGKNAQQMEFGPTKDDSCITSMLSIARLGKPEVTGIIIDGVTAKAEFDYQITPINESESLFSDPSKISDTGKHAIEYQISSFPPMKIGNDYFGHGTAEFRKYDDGWRTESVVTIQ